ncbi:MAG: hypothetical protein WBM09_10495, partial [Gallionella sp.]
PLQMKNDFLFNNSDSSTLHLHYAGACSAFPYINHIWRQVARNPNVQFRAANLDIHLSLVGSILAGRHCLLSGSTISNCLMVRPHERMMQSGSLFQIKS